MTEEKQTTFCIDGNLVASIVPQLRSSLRELIASGVRFLVIDLSKVQMLDSAGLGLLISVHNTLQKAGGQVSVVQASPDVLELLSTMRIHQHFPVSGR